MPQQIPQQKGQQVPIDIVKKGKKIRFQGLGVYGKRAAIWPVIHVFSLKFPQLSSDALERDCPKRRSQLQWQKAAEHRRHPRSFGEKSASSQERHRWPTIAFPNEPQAQSVWILVASPILVRLRLAGSPTTTSSIKAVEDCLSTSNSKLSKTSSPSASAPFPDLAIYSPTQNGRNPLEILDKAPKLWNQSCFCTLRWSRPTSKGPVASWYLVQMLQGQEPALRESHCTAAISK